MTYLGDYSNTYVDQIFFIWYNAEKPSTTKLHEMIPEFVAPDGRTNKPNVDTLKKWVINDFAVRAEMLDSEVINKMNAMIVNQKISMLQRHIQTSQVMQSMAVEYLQAHKEDMTAPAAIRLLIEGIRIEKESVGLPEALEKMTQMTDDELMEEVQRYLTDKSQIIDIE